MGNNSTAPAPAGPVPAGAGGAVKKGCCAKVDDGSQWGMMPDNKRKCRDVGCCLFFALFWLGMIIIGAIGLRLGKWQRLVFGTDYNGQICGADVKSKSYITYPRTNEDFLANLGKTNPYDYKFYGICVSTCPQTLDVICNYGFGEAAAETPDVKRSCLTDDTYSPPAGVDCTALAKNCWITAQSTSSIMFRCIPVYNVSNTQGNVCSYPPSITDANDPSCIIVTENRVGAVQRPAKPNLLFDQLNTGRQLWGRWFGDLARSWWVILLCSVGLAIVMGFVWVMFLKYFTGCMVWTTIVLSVLVLAFLTGYLYYRAGLVNIVVPASLADKLSNFPGQAAASAAVASAAAQAQAKAEYLVPQSWQDQATEYNSSYKSLAYISTGVLIMVICVVVAMRNAIRTSIEVIKLGTDALRALPTLILFPCSNVLAIGLFLVWWVFVAACLGSAGDITLNDASKDIVAGLAALQKQYNMSGAAFANATAEFMSLPSVNTTYKSIEDKPVMNYLMIYHVFGLLWTTQFIQGVATMTIAGAVSSWYFSQLPKEAEADPEIAKLKYTMGRMPILGSLYRTVRYYLGTVAFGSLLIAIIQFIRMVFAYIQRKMKDQAENNSSIKFIFCCIQCCLKCLQSLVEIVTRNAYVFVALKGDSFCGAGRRVFSLIVNHGSVFAVVNVLGEVLMFLGKVVISCVCAWGAYVLLGYLPEFQTGGPNELSSTWLPILVTTFFAYATASGFMMIFDLSVDTVLVCYVTDIDENVTRNGGDSKFKFPLHIAADKLNVKKKMADQDAASKAAKDAKAAPTPAVGKAPSVA